MAEPPVVNASPVIILARIGRPELLRVAGERVIVPAAVATEVRRHGPPDPAARLLAEAPWLQIVEVGPAPAPIREWRLGAGESAVLTWALSHPGTEALIDDLPARRRAEMLGILVRGTLSLVIGAKELGVIPAARPVVGELRRAGLHLSDQVIDRALARVGE